MTVEDVVKAQDLLWKRESLEIVRDHADAGHVALLVNGNHQNEAMKIAVRPVVVASIDSDIALIDEQLRGLGVELL